MITAPSGFLDERRLLDGPWQAFERDIARLLIASGFDDVRLVAGSGDHGGDVIGVRKGKLWVWQCKFTTASAAPVSALEELIEAGRFYGAERLVLATSRPATDSLRNQQNHYKRLGLSIEIAQPGDLIRLAQTASEYPPARHVLRDYQEEASRRFREGLVDTGKAQITMATGLGKTVVMADVVADLLQDGIVRHGTVLVLAHTRELVIQLHRSFWYQLPKWVPTHQLSEGEAPVNWEGVTFATVQSVRSRLDSIPPVGLVLIDEAHHVGAETFRLVLESIQSPMVGGVTATPWRGDGYDIDRLLGPPLVQIGIAEGLRRGFLAEVDYRLLADNVDWEVVQNLSEHGYSLPQLNRSLIIPTRDDEAAKTIREVFDSESLRGGIAYCATILHAEHFAGTLRHYGFRAEAIASTLSARERDALLSRFRAGQLDIVTTVDLFNEGVDVPDVDLIVFMRTTHSRRIFVQQIGRGLRLQPGKTRVVVLDFVTDLRRIAEVIELDRAVKRGQVEELGLGTRVIQFRDASAGGFMREWMLDQASIFLREGDPTLTLPELEFPSFPGHGGVQ